MDKRNRPFRPDPDVVATDLGDGEMVLLHLQSKAYYSLNTTGTRVWEGLRKGLTPEEISLRLQEEFHVGAAQADRSVVRLLAELAGQKLVQVEPLEDAAP
jgi:hypothetical protein